MQNTKNHPMTRWRRVCRSRIVDRIRVGQNRRRILKRAVGGEGEEEQEEEKEREGENRWRSVFVKRTETKRARVPNNDYRGFHFPISKEEEKKRVVPFDSNRPFDARELSLVAPRVASVELASARPHRHRCDSRSCLRVRALFYGVRRIKNPLK